MDFGIDQRIQVRRDPVDHLVIDGLFDAARNRAIFEHVLALRDRFEPAVIGPDRRVDEGYRRNLICYPDYFLGYFNSTNAAGSVVRAARMPMRIARPVKRPK